MRKSQLICSLLALALCLLPAGCRSREAEEPVEPENVTLIIKTPVWEIFPMWERRGHMT